MLDKIKIATKDSFIYSLGNITNKVIGLILLPVYLKELTVAEYGMLGILEVTLQVVIAFFGFSIHQSFNRWFWDKDYHSKQGSIYFTTLVFSLFSAALMVIFLSFFSEKFSYLLLNSEKYSYLLMLMIGSASLQIIKRIPLSMMRLQRRAIRFVVSNVIQLIITLLLTIYFIVYQGKKLDGIFEAQIIGFAFLLLFNAKYILDNIHPVFEKNILKEMIDYSFPLMISALGGVLLSVADRFFIKFIEGLENIGVYSLGFKIANVLKLVFIQSVFSAINPLRFRMMNDSDHPRFYSKIMTYSVFGFLFLQMGLMYFSKELLFLLAENKQHWTYTQINGAVHIIPVLCFAQLFEILRRNVRFGLNIVKKTKIVSVVMLFSASMNIVLNMLFISLLGTIGAAIATLAAQIIFFALIYHYAQKYYYIPYELKKVFLMIGVVIVLTIFAYSINSIILIPRLIIKFLLIVSFPFVLYLIGFFEPLELQRIKESWRKWKNPRNWNDNLKKIKIK
jgi:O-antigen/teichoic acid export membrane protein